MVTALQSLIKKLSPLGVYDITEGTNIYAELSAYAFAIDKHRENMSEVMREGFISTAEDYGITIREKVFGNLRPDYSVEQRREMLRLRRGFGDSDFTPAGFDRFMRGLGVEDYRLSEMYADESVAITLNNTFNDTDAKWITNQIKLILPAHLTSNVYYGGPTFAQTDSDNLTWDGFDNLDRTWQQIESI